MYNHSFGEWVLFVDKTGLEGKELETQKTLQELFDKPEHALFVRFILSLLLEHDRSAGEEYDKMLDTTTTKLKDEKVRESLLSGRLLLRSVMIKSEL